MGVKERKEREKLQRKESILKAAENIYLEKGWEQLSMDRIAEACELSKGTLYLYFKNKDQLLTHLYDKYLNLLLEMINNDMQSMESSFAKLNAASKAVIRFAKEEPSRFRLIWVYENQGLMNTFSGEQYSGIKSKHPVVDIFIETIRNGIHDSSMTVNLNPTQAGINLYLHLTITLQYAFGKESYLEENYGAKPDQLIASFSNFLMRVTRS